MKKRLISLLTVFAMILGMVPFALADGDVPEDAVARTGDTYYDILQNAIFDAVDGGTVTLTQDITTDESIYCDCGDDAATSVTLDLNGHTVQTSGIFSADYGSLTVTSGRTGGTIIADDVSASEDGDLSIEGSVSNPITVVRRDQFYEVSSGSISASYVHFGSTEYRFYVLTGEGSLNFEHCTFDVGAAPGSENENICWFHSGETVVLKDCTFDYADGVNAEDVEFEVEGTYNLDGSTIPGNGEGIDGEPDGNPQTFYFATAAARETFLASDSGELFRALEGSDTGVVYGQSVPEARIGDTYYETLQDAFDAAEDDQTVTLLCDVSSDSTVTCGSSEQDYKDVILDLDGHTLRYAGSEDCFILMDNALLTIVSSSVGGTIDFGNGGYISCDLDNPDLTESLTIRGTFDNRITLLADFSEDLHSDGACQIFVKDAFSASYVDFGDANHRDLWIIETSCSINLDHCVFYYEDIGDDYGLWTLYSYNTAEGAVTLKDCTYNVADGVDPTGIDYGIYVDGTFNLDGSTIPGNGWGIQGEPDGNPQTFYFATTAARDAFLASDSGALFRALEGSDTGVVYGQSVPEARTGDTVYYDLPSAFVAAEGETVTLLTELDNYGYNVVVPTVKTFDLDGNRLALNVSKYAAVFGKIQDSGNGNGLLQLAKSNFMVMPGDNGGYLPVYDVEAGGYRFVQINAKNFTFADNKPVYVVANTSQTEAEDDYLGSVPVDTLKLIFKPQCAAYSAFASLLGTADGNTTKDAGVSLKIHVYLSTDGSSWNETKVYTYSAKHVCKVFNNPSTVCLMAVRNLSKLGTSSMKLVISAESDTMVSYNLCEYTYSAT